jgi:SdrD B-like domain
MHRMKRRLAAGCTTLAAALALALGGADLTALAEDDSSSDLRVTAAFDKPAYDSGDVVHVTVTITNAGAAAVEDAFVIMDGFPLYLDEPGWGDLAYGGEPARIEPGATRVVELAGTIVDPSTGVLRFAGHVYPIVSPDDNSFAISAPVTRTYGDFGGTIIEDRNGNGAADPGEGVSGIHVSMSGGAPYWFYDQVTDVQGRFLFDDLPTGRYVSDYGSENGWVVGPQYPDEDRWVVTTAGTLDVVVLAARPISEKLIVTAEFAQPTYGVGDEAHVALTIRNRTGTTVTGIHAHCTDTGKPNQFKGVGPGWAQFAEDGPGATVAAGETATFDVYETVPAGALQYGYVALGCEIGPGAGTGARGLPYAQARAKVPGEWTWFDIKMVDNRDGSGITDTKIAVLDYDTHQVVATATTDYGGRINVIGVPAGLYELRIAGPWRTYDGHPVVFDARAGYPPMGLYLALVPRGQGPG